MKNPMSVREHPYFPFLEQLRRPSRYLGGEHGQITKGWNEVQLRFVLAFPDLYELGMSHLGMKILYQEVNARPELLCERAFAPEDDLEQQLRARNLPLVSLESWRPLCCFDVVGFSLQYELTYTNLMNMLDLSGIPRRAAARGEGDPLVIAGGPCALHPEPLAPFVDAFFVGEGEAALPALLLAVARLRREGAGRRTLLQALAGLEGVYVPSCYEVVATAPHGFEVVGDPLAVAAPPRVRRVLVDDLDRYAFPALSPVAATETTFDRLSMEIARGCNQGCRFCQAGMTYRPVRERSVAAVLDTVLAALRATGYDEVSLTSLSTADYSALPLLVGQLGERLHEARAALSVSSLRAYGLGEELLRAIARVRTTGLTFAPEAGTQRLREVINKNVGDADLESSAAQAFRTGWSKLKLYFMIGLPGETGEDLTGILDTVARVRAIGRQLRGRSVEVTAAIATFVPRPHTPFQWAAMDTPEELERKQRWLLQEARQRRLQLRLHDRQASRLEGIFARGDRRLAAALERAYQLGARFDGWDERLRPEIWQQAFAEAGLQPEEYLIALQPGQRLPWDHIDAGVSPEFLEREWQRARRAQASAPCLSASPRSPERVVCHRCGMGCALSELLARRAVARAGAGPASPAGEQVAGGGGAGREAAGREVSLVAGRAGRAGRGGRAPGSRGPAPAFAQAEAQRFRLNYAKLDRATFLGHLDVVRDLPRILRRAGLTAHYTEGYHPKPAMTFGPALRLGIPSLGEWVDVLVEGETTAEQLLERLNEVTTAGIRFLRAGRLDAGAIRLSRLITLVEHGLLLDEQAAARFAATWGDPGRWRSGGPALVTMRRGERSVELPWAEVVAGSLLEPAGGLPGLLDLPRLPLLRLLLRLRPEGWGARAEDVVPALGLHLG
ncbi:MAG: TIGR03960 family B12-binding radical SAM protein, partial [Deltaproteobacteria bacterium]|nr:TIGR03960 family B12-binding radical SAM protein [Deltaproteobacteria bacterium]